MPKRSDVLLRILEFAETHCIGHPAHFAARSPNFLRRASSHERACADATTERQTSKESGLWRSPQRSACGEQARWRARIFRVRTRGVGESKTLRSNRSLAYPPCFLPNRRRPRSSSKNSTTNLGLCLA